MNATKLLTALMAVLVVSAGAGAVSAASLDADTTTVDAAYTDGTVTLTVLENETGVENVSVSTDNFSGETDANGTVAFDTNATELDVEFSKNGTTFERSYVIDNGTISEATEEDVEEASELSATATLDNNTVSVDVMHNDSAAENVTVTANDVEKGMTDANGTLSFGIDNETENLTLVFEKDNMSLTQEYTVENGSLVMAGDDEEGEKELSANENASERAHKVLSIIQGFLTDGSEGDSLGQMIQEALGDDRGNSENAKDNGNAAETGNSDKGNGNDADAQDKGNGKDKGANGKEKGNSDKGNGNGNSNGNGNGNGNADDDDETESDE